MFAGILVICWQYVNNMFATCLAICHIFHQLEQSWSTVRLQIGADLHPGPGLGLGQGPGRAGPQNDKKSPPPARAAQAAPGRAGPLLHHAHGFPAPPILETVRAVNAVRQRPAKHSSVR